MSLLGNEGGNGGAGSGSGQGSGAGAGAGAGQQQQQNSGGSGGGQGGNSGGAGAGSGGASTPTWRDSLPDDLKNDPSLLPFSDLTSLAKSYVNTKAMVGKKGVTPPAWDKASDQEKADFFKSIGVPEKIDDFKLQTPKDKQIQAEFLDKFREQAHKAGMLPQQAQQLFDWYLGYEAQAVGSRAEATKAQAVEALNGLKKEWGQGYDKNVALAKMAVEKLGGSDMQAYMDKSGLGNNVELIKLMAKAGALLGEDQLRGDGGGKFGKTPAEIDREISEIMAHPAYSDRSHGQHKIMVAKAEELFKAKFSA